jgi:uncharacterized protein YkwD
MSGSALRFACLALTAALFASVAGGCSVGSTSPSFGLNDSSQTATRQAARRPAAAGLGVEPAPLRTGTAGGTKVAALAPDQAPSGSYDKAPKGVLADRDYSRTALNPEAARDIINAYRKQNGLKPLKLDTALTNAAKAHSRDLSKWDRISHYGSDGSNPWDRVKRVGYNARLAAENVGTGQATFEEVMKGWQESPGHNKNLLLADAEFMGIALVTEPGTEFKSFWTLVLASPI